MSLKFKQSKIILSWFIIYHIRVFISLCWFNFVTLVYLSPQKTKEGVYRVPYSLLGWGEFIKFVGEEYQVLKRGRDRNNMAVGKNITLEKRERGSNIIFPIIFWLFGKNIKLGKGKGD